MQTVIKAYNKKEMQRMREEAYNLYISADLNGASVARIMDNKAKFPKLYEVFPALFKKPIIPKVQDWRIAKDRLMRFAEAHNKKLSETKEQDNK